jgi:ribosome biogenesis protein MAK21
MEGGEAPMKPDFASHTLLHFLDRFIYRSARSTPEKSKGSSIMQPLQGTSSASVLLTGRSTSTQLSVNSEQFWRKQLSQVAVDEVFFHQYFTHMGKSSTTRNRQEIRQMKQQNDRQEKEDGDDENEDEIWKALVDSRPEVEGDMSSDDDIGFEDSEEDLEDYDDDTSEVDIEGDGAIEDDSGNSDIQMVDEDTDLELEGDGDSSEIDNDDTDGLSLSQLPGKNTLQRSKRRKLKNLPTFASAEDYAELLAKEVDGREE